MTAAWFQLITSENGNSHPLLSITGTQAAWAEEGFREEDSDSMDHSNQEKKNQDKLNYWHCLCYMVPDCSGQKESKWFGINKSPGL